MLLNHLPSKVLAAAPIGWKRGLRRGVLVLSLGMVVGFCGQGAGQEVAPLNDDVATEARVPNPKEQKVKAAYIYNFCKYFNWPEESFKDPNAPIVIGVLGDDTLGNQLDLLAAKKTAKKRKIVIRRFKTMADYQPCHLLFVPTVVGLPDLKGAVKETGDVPLLIVSDGHKPPGHGAAVTFFWKEDNTIGFEIDLNAVNNRKLEVSAKLLKIARVTRR